MRCEPRHAENIYAAGALACRRCRITYDDLDILIQHLYWKHGTEGQRCSGCYLKKWTFAIHKCHALPGIHIDDIEEVVFPDNIDRESNSIYETSVNNNVVEQSGVKLTTECLESSSIYETSVNNNFVGPSVVKAATECVVPSVVPSDNESSCSPTSDYGSMISQCTQGAPPAKSPYCYCGVDVPGAMMIACDGPKCRYEWFHFGCVGVQYVPEEEWFCPECR